MNFLKTIYGYIKWASGCALIFIFLFNLADIIAKGRELNNFLPYPVLGYAFVVIGSVLVFFVVWLVWVLIVAPIWEFRRLSACRPLTERERAFRLRDRLAYSKGPNYAGTLQQKLYNKLIDGDYESALKEYDENLGLDAIIVRYSVSSAVGVVISHNAFIDGIVMLLLQMKMVVDMAREEGYKPSPLFNLLCFGWIFFNSLVTALCAQEIANTIETTTSDIIHQYHAGEIEVDADASEILIDEAERSTFDKIVSSSSGKLVEGVMAAIPVFVTGMIFKRNLRGEHKIGTLADIMRYRKTARKSLVVPVFKKLVPYMAAEIAIEQGAKLIRVSSALAVQTARSVIGM